MSALDPRRSETVGASEVSCLFSAGWPEPDIPPFDTRFGLWAKKAGLVEDDFNQSEAMFWGSTLEAAILQGVAERTGWEIHPAAWARSETNPRMSATPDALIHYISPVRPDAPAVADVKNVSRWEWRSWAERQEPGLEWFEQGEWRPAAVQPPLKYKLQLQQQAACVGTSAAILAVLVAGQELRLFRLSRHDGVIRRLDSEITSFWGQVESRTPPAPDWLVDADTIRALYPHGEPGTTLDLTSVPELVTLAEEYTAAGRAKREAEDRHKAAGAKLIATIGTAERAILPGGYVATTYEVAEKEITYSRKRYRALKLTAPREKAEAAA